MKYKRYVYFVRYTFWRGKEEGEGMIRISCRRSLKHMEMVVKVATYIADYNKFSKVIINNYELLRKSRISK